jgi:hypothetical protein
MVRSLRSRLICVGVAFGLAACSLDADIPGRRVGDASAIANGLAGDDSGASEGETAEGSASGGAPQASSGRSGGASASRASAGRSASAGAWQASTGGIDSGGASPASAGRMVGGTASQANTGTGIGTGGIGSGGAWQASTGGIDSGGASRASVGGIGGAVSGRGGAAGAGGETTDARNPLAGSSGAANATNSSPPALFFSEYVEGSSSNKALELAAQARIALDGCKITTYFNGRSDATVVASLTGILEAGQILTVCTSTLKEKLGSICDQVGNLTFNGNDAVAISCDSTILDVIGQIGIDPGAAWGTDPNSTVDHTLRRKCSIKSGVPIDPRALDLSFDPSEEWQAFPVDTFDGLGSRGC